jgi:hypothetical protein
VWLGYQHWRALSVEIYILTEEIPGHPCGSTVSRETLQAAGFSVPPPVGETDDLVALGTQHKDRSVAFQKVLSE